MNTAVKLFDIWVVKFDPPGGNPVKERTLIPGRPEADAIAGAMRIQRAFAEVFVRPSPHSSRM